MAQKQAAAPQWNKDDEDATTLSLGPGLFELQFLFIVYLFIQFSFFHF